MNPSVLSPIQVEFSGQQPPDGLFWSCQHPDCVAEDEYGHWGGAGVGTHCADAHQQPVTPVLVSWPDFYGGGGSCDEWMMRDGRIKEAAAKRQKVMIDCRSFVWPRFEPDDSKCGLRPGFVGAARIARSWRRRNHIKVRPLDGSPAFTILPGQVRWMRAPLPGELA